MRILVVHSFYRPGLPSGENDVVRTQVDLLRARGFEVDLWGPTSPDDARLEHKLRMATRLVVGVGEDPRAEIERTKPDLVHVHNTFPSVSLSWLRGLAVPTVMSVHNYRSVCANGVFLRSGAACTECLTQSATRAVKYGCYRDSAVATLPVLPYQRHLRAAIDDDLDTVIYTSELSEEVLSGRLHPRRSVVLPNYVAPVESEDVGSGPEAESDEPYFVVLGRLTPEKGVGELLRMWPSGLRLKIVGDGPLREELERSAPASVEFLGFVDADIRDRLLAQARGLILPSLTLEADPVVVAQALSAGTPCVVGSHTASARLASRSPAVHQYSDAVTLHAELKQLDQADRAESARQAQQLYRERWSADAWIRGYEEKIIEPLVTR